ncbi:hypothetical protein Bca52824_058622 [Brassica carinata]|uniref:Uncharacterized protein n=1 Tax=Brassica carinata TaxID=52824 RepID=A0A8X7QTJ7_BRACI|nr:hypothetical protein Bca52824_058622 [Brassica carinata]
MLTLHILLQDETPLLYSLVLGEGVVNDATSVVHFNVVQKIHVESIYSLTALRVFENFLAILSVLDNTGTSAFLGFDTKVTKLTGIEASEAAQIVVDTDLPRSLADIVGSTYTFQLRLKDFNFTANHQTFTISLIFPARELAPMPTFAEGVQVPEAVTPGSDARLANTCKVAEQATTSDVSLPGRLAAAKEQVVLERLPRRKHV